MEDIRFTISLHDATAQAFRTVGSNLDRLRVTTATFQASVGKLRSEMTGLFALGASGAGLVYLGNRFIDMASTIGDTADRIGATAEQLQELRYAAKVSGVEASTLDSTMLVFSRNLGLAKTGAGEARKALGDLGFSMADIREKGTVELFDEIADRLGRISDPLRRNADLAQLFGRQGVQLAILLDQTAGSYKDVEAAAHSMGLVVSNDVIRRNHEAGDSFSTIGSAIDAAGMNITAGFLPAIKKVEAIMTSADFQNGVRVAADGMSDFVQATVRDAEKLKDVAETIGRLYLAFKGAQLGRVGGVPGMIAGGAAGYFSPEMVQMLAGAGNGRGGLDPNSTIGKHVLQVDVTQPANMAEIRAWQSRRDASPAAKLGSLSGWAQSDWEEASRASKQIDSVVKGLRDQLATLGMTDRQMAIHNGLIQAGTTETTKAGQEIAALTGQYFDQRQALDALNQSQQFFADVTYSAFDALIVQGDSLTDTIDNIAKALISATLQATLLGQGPLAGLLGTKSDTQGGVGGVIGAILSAVMGGGGSGTSVAATGIGHMAKGGVLGAGPMRFASGGVFSSPMVFPMARGMGLLGEAGPEAVMPLTRDSAGRLGVRGGGGGSPVNIQIINHAGAEVKTEQKQGPDGSINLQVLLDKAGADNLTRGGSHTNRAAKSIFGLRQPLRKTA